MDGLRAREAACRIPGRRFEAGVAEVTQLGNGRYLVGGRLAYAAATAQARWVFLDGQVYVIEVQHVQAVTPDDDLTLAAPMPATVTAIPVTLGQQVTLGEVLIMLEA